SHLAKRHAALTAPHAILYALRRQVVPGHWQTEETLARGGVDGITQRRRKRWRARLANATWRRINVHNVHLDAARRIGHARHQVVVKVALLDTAFFGGDLAVASRAHPIETGALHRPPHAVRVPHAPGVYSHINAWDGDLAVLGDGRLHRHPHIGGEAAVHRQANAMALGELLAVARLGGSEFEHVGQP